MKLNKVIILFLSLLLVYTVFLTVTSYSFSYQEEEIENLAPKYKVFLRDARTLMTPEDLHRFLRLKNDKQRDGFIRAFRRSQRSRDNVRTLYLLRMTQILNLTEEQAAMIYPRITRVEKEKHELNKNLNRLLRELRARLRDENVEEEELAGRVQEIKDLSHRLKDIDRELELFLEQTLTVEQQAKYLMFHSDFTRRLRQQLEEARKSKK